MADQIDIKKDFDTVFRQHYKMAVLYAHKYVQDLDTARDVAQGVFIKLFDRKKDIKLQSSIKSYILTAVKNASLNYIRGQNVRQLHNEQAMSAITSSYELNKLEYEDLLRRVNDELNNLPTRCAEIFKMNRFDGMKNKEIASQLNISIRTVETQMSNALKHLRKAIPRNFSISILFWLSSTCFVGGTCHILELNSQSETLKMKSDTNDHQADAIKTLIMNQ